MSTLAGSWGEPTIHGTDSLTVDGRQFSVPEGADIRFVRGSGYEIAHVRLGGRVQVLSRLGQLIEDDSSARSRATGTNWRMLSWLS